MMSSPLSRPMSSGLPYRLTPAPLPRGGLKRCEVRCTIGTVGACIRPATGVAAIGTPRRLGDPLSPLASYTQHLLFVPPRTKGTDHDLATRNVRSSPNDARS